ncbi:MAG TPA: glycosyl hydrolase [Arcobacter sp.]|nr:glycosyl hydrolase [Arcobacter sp.]
MKKYILLFILIMTGCDELKELEGNLSTEVNQSSEEISIKAEDSLYASLLIEESTREEPLIEGRELDEFNETKVYKEKPLIGNKKVDGLKETKNYSDTELTALIGNMFIVGFYGTNINTKSQIVKDIEKYHIGGVILFDKHPSKRGKSKNIKNPTQLKNLTKKLQNYSSYPLLIATDQEGGKVARLKIKTGFKTNYPSAKDIATKYKIKTIEKIYDDMGKTLANAGINLNFAPSVDMEINPKNIVIVKLKRSYGKDPKRVVMFSKIFIEAMHNNNILTSLKHFPGHGSSKGDTHKGFVEITNFWKEEELEPYKILIEDNFVDTIMIAHVFNKKIDEKYPSSLSHKTVTKKLREEMGYKGVVVTDDLQMYAISKHFSLQETIKLSINAGVDLLLFGNQLDPKNIISVKKLVETTLSLVKSEEIQVQTLIDANHRINNLKEKLSYNYKNKLEQKEKEWNIVE